MSRKKTQNALNSFLVAADALVKMNQIIEAEIRYKDALKQAEKDYGINSDQTMLVSSILSAFYRTQNREAEAIEIEARLFAWTMEPQKAADAEGARRFVGGAKSEQPSSTDERSVRIPASLRRPCQILGLNLEEPLSVANINKAWKKQMLSQGAHPDLGGNTDEAVLLNKAKEQLMAYLDERAPKLGSKFKK
ncbi:MAG: hypothetical protein K2X29_12080 [Candidatus Obscuribacterales bacterium]|nr:hypothetical protein [Candidatus Obscuribacterales bacterium]